MNTGQTVYEQLDSILSNCGKRIPFGLRFEQGLTYRTCDDGGVRFYNEVFGKLCTYSYHDLFSVESGIMEFVEWKPLEKASSIQLKILYEYGLRDYNYIMMSLLTAQEKVEYFIENARVPTK